jgi:hypothetical protein
MAYRFEFDSTNQVLRARFDGRITDQELKEYYKLAAQVYTRISPRSFIADFAAVTDAEVSPDTVRDLANLPPTVSDEAKPRFIVAAAPNIFGLARMFQLEGEQTRPNLHVVHKLGEACAILGVHRLKFKPIPAE